MQFHFGVLFLRRFQSHGKNASIFYCSSLENLLFTQIPCSLRHFHDITSDTQSQSDIPSVNFLSNCVNLCLSRKTIDDGKISITRDILASAVQQDESNSNRELSSPEISLETCTTDLIVDSRLNHQGGNNESMNIVIRPSKEKCNIVVDMKYSYSSSSFHMHWGDSNQRLAITKVIDLLKLTPELDLKRLITLTHFLLSMIINNLTIENEDINQIWYSLLLLWRKKNMAWPSEVFFPNLLNRIHSHTLKEQMDSSIDVLGLMELFRSKKTYWPWFSMVALYYKMKPKDSLISHDFEISVDIISLWIDNLKLSKTAAHLLVWENAETILTQLFRAITLLHHNKVEIGVLFLHCHYNIRILMDEMSKSCNCIEKSTTLRDKYISCDYNIEKGRKNAIQMVLSLIKVIHESSLSISDKKKHWCLLWRILTQFSWCDYWFPVLEANESSVSYDMLLNDIILCLFSFTLCECIIEGSLGSHTHFNCDPIQQSCGSRLHAWNYYSGFGINQDSLTSSLTIADRFLVYLSKCKGTISSITHYLYQKIFVWEGILEYGAPEGNDAIILHLSIQELSQLLKNISKASDPWLLSCLVMKILFYSLWRSTLNRSGPSILCSGNDICLFWSMLCEKINDRLPDCKLAQNLAYHIITFYLASSALFRVPETLYSRPIFYSLKQLYTIAIKRSSDNTSENLLLTEVTRYYCSIIYNVTHYLRRSASEHVNHSSEEMLRLMFTFPDVRAILHGMLPVVDFILHRSTTPCWEDALWMTHRIHRISCDLVGSKSHSFYFSLLSLLQLLQEGRGEFSTQSFTSTSMLVQKISVWTAIPWRSIIRSVFSDGSCNAHGFFFPSRIALCNRLLSDKLDSLSESCRTKLQEKVKHFQYQEQWIEAVMLFQTNISKLSPEEDWKHFFFLFKYAPSLASYIINCLISSPSLMSISMRLSTALSVCQMIARSIHNRKCDNPGRDQESAEKFRKFDIFYHENYWLLLRVLCVWYNTTLELLSVSSEGGDENLDPIYHINNINDVRYEKMQHSLDMTFKKILPPYVLFFLINSSHVILPQTVRLTLIKLRYSIAVALVNNNTPQAFLQLAYFRCKFPYYPIPYSIFVTLAMSLRKFSLDEEHDEFVTVMQYDLMNTLHPVSQLSPTVNAMNTESNERELKLEEQKSKIKSENIRVAKYSRSIFKTDNFFSLSYKGDLFKTEKVVTTRELWDVLVEAIQCSSSYDDKIIPMTMNEKMMNTINLLYTICGADKIIDKKRSYTLFTEEDIQQIPEYFTGCSWWYEKTVPDEYAENVLYLVELLYLKVLPWCTLPIKRLFLQIASTLTRVLMIFQLEWIGSRKIFHCHYLPCNFKGNGTVFPERKLEARCYRVSNFMSKLVDFFLNDKNLLTDTKNAEISWNWISFVSSHLKESLFSFQLKENTYFNMSIDIPVNKVQDQLPSMLNMLSIEIVTFITNTQYHQLWKFFEKCLSYLRYILTQLQYFSRIDNLQDSNSMVYFQSSAAFTKKGVSTKDALIDIHWLIEQFSSIASIIEMLCYTLRTSMCYTFLTIPSENKLDSAPNSVIAHQSSEVLLLIHKTVELFLSFFNSSPPPNNRVVKKKLTSSDWTMRRKIIMPPKRDIIVCGMKLCCLLQFSKEQWVNNEFIQRLYPNSSKFIEELIDLFPYLLLLDTGNQTLCHPKIIQEIINFDISMCTPDMLKRFLKSLTTLFPPFSDEFASIWKYDGWRLIQLLINSGKAHFNLSIAPLRSYLVIISNWYVGLIKGLELSDERLNDKESVLNMSPLSNSDLREPFLGDQYDKHGNNVTKEIAILESSEEKKLLLANTMPYEEHKDLINHIELLIRITFFFDCEKNDLHLSEIAHLLSELKNQRLFSIFENHWFSEQLLNHPCVPHFNLLPRSMYCEYFVIAYAWPKQKDLEFSQETEELQWRKIFRFLTEIAPHRWDLLRIWLFCVSFGVTGLMDNNHDAKMLFSRRLLYSFDLWPSMVSIAEASEFLFFKMICSNTPSYRKLFSTLGITEPFSMRHGKPSLWILSPEVNKEYQREYSLKDHNDNIILTFSGHVFQKYFKLIDEEGIASFENYLFQGIIEWLSSLVSFKQKDYRDFSSTIVSMVAKLRLIQSFPEKIQVGLLYHQFGNTNSLINHNGFSRLEKNVPVCWDSPSSLLLFSGLVGKDILCRFQKENIPEAIIIGSEPLSCGVFLWEMMRLRIPFPKILMQNIDWWSLLIGGLLFCKETRQNLSQHNPLPYFSRKGMITSYVSVSKFQEWLGGDMRVNVLVGKGAGLGEECNIILRFPDALFETSWVLYNFEKNVKKLSSSLSKSSESMRFSASDLRKILLIPEKLSIHELKLNLVEKDSSWYKRICRFNFSIDLEKRFRCFLSTSSILWHPHLVLNSEMNNTKIVSSETSIPPCHTDSFHFVIKTFSIYIGSSFGNFLCELASIPFDGLPFIPSLLLHTCDLIRQSGDYAPVAIFSTLLFRFSELGERLPEKVIFSLIRCYEESDHRIQEKDNSLWNSLVHVVSHLDFRKVSHTETSNDTVARDYINRWSTKWMKDYENNICPTKVWSLTLLCSLIEDAKNICEIWIKRYSLLTNFFSEKVTRDTFFTCKTSWFPTWIVESVLLRWESYTVDEFFFCIKLFSSKMFNQFFGDPASFVCLMRWLRGRWMINHKQINKVDPADCKLVSIFWLGLYRFVHYYSLVGDILESFEKFENICMTSNQSIDIFFKKDILENFFAEDIRLYCKHLGIPSGVPYIISEFIVLFSKHLEDFPFQDIEKHIILTMVDQWGGVMHSCSSHKDCHKSNYYTGSIEDYCWWRRFRPSGTDALQAMAHFFFIRERIQATNVIDNKFFKFILDSERHGKVDIAQRPRSEDEVSVLISFFFQGFLNSVLVLPGRNSDNLRIDRTNHLYTFFLTYVYEYKDTLVFNSEAIKSQVNNEGKMPYTAIRDFHLRPLNIFSPYLRDQLVSFFGLLAEHELFHPIDAKYHNYHPEKSTLTCRKLLFFFAGFWKNQLNVPARKDHFIESEKNTSNQYVQEGFKFLENSVKNGSLMKFCLFKKVTDQFQIDSKTLCQNIIHFHFAIPMTSYLLSNIIFHAKSMKPCFSNYRGSEPMPKQSSSNPSFIDKISDIITVRYQYIPIFFDALSSFAELIPCISARYYSRFFNSTKPFLLDNLRIAKKHSCDNKVSLGNDNGISEYSLRCMAILRLVEGLQQVSLVSLSIILQSIPSEVQILLWSECLLELKKNFSSEIRNQFLFLLRNMTPLIKPKVLPDNLFSLDFRNAQSDIILRLMEEVSWKQALDCYNTYVRKSFPTSQHHLFSLNILHLFISKLKENRWLRSKNSTIYQIREVVKGTWFDALILLSHSYQSDHSIEKSKSGNFLNQKDTLSMSAFILYYLVRYSSSMAVAARSELMITIGSKAIEHNLFHVICLTLRYLLQQKISISTILFSLNFLKLLSSLINKKCLIYAPRDSKNSFVNFGDIRLIVVSLYLRALYEWYLSMPNIRYKESWRNVSMFINQSYNLRSLIHSQLTVEILENEPYSNIPSTENLWRIESVFIHELFKQQQHNLLMKFAVEVKHKPSKKTLSLLAQSCAFLAPGAISQLLHFFQLREYKPVTQDTLSRLLEEGQSNQTLQQLHETIATLEGGKIRDSIIFIRLYFGLRFKQDILFRSHSLHSLFQHMESPTKIQYLRLWFTIAFGTDQMERHYQEEYCLGTSSEAFIDTFDSGGFFLVEYFPTDLLLMTLRIFLKQPEDQLTDTSHISSSISQEVNLVSTTLSPLSSRLSVSPSISERTPGSYSLMAILAIELFSRILALDSDRSLSLARELGIEFATTLDILKDLESTFQVLFQAAMKFRVCVLPMTSFSNLSSFFSKGSFQRLLFDNIDLAKLFLNWCSFNFPSDVYSLLSKNHKAIANCPSKSPGVQINNHFSEVMEWCALLYQQEVEIVRILNSGSSDSGFLSEGIKHCIQYRELLFANALKLHSNSKYWLRALACFFSFTKCFGTPIVSSNDVEKVFRLVFYSGSSHILRLVIKELSRFPCEEMCDNRFSDAVFPKSRIFFYNKSNLYPNYEKNTWIIKNSCKSSTNCWFLIGQVCGISSTDSVCRDGWSHLSNVLEELSIKVTASCWFPVKCAIQCFQTIRRFTIKEVAPVSLRETSRSESLNSFVRLFVKRYLLTDNITNTTSSQDREVLAKFLFNSITGDNGMFSALKCLETITFFFLESKSDYYKIFLFTLKSIQRIQVTSADNLVNVIPFLVRVCQRIKVCQLDISKNISTSSRNGMDLSMEMYAYMVEEILQILWIHFNSNTNVTVITGKSQWSDNYSRLCELLQDKKILLDALEADLISHYILIQEVCQNEFNEHSREVFSLLTVIPIPNSEQ